MERIREGDDLLSESEEEPRTREKRPRRDRAAMSLINSNLAEPVNAVAAARILPEDPDRHTPRDKGGARRRKDEDTRRDT